MTGAFNDAPGRQWRTGHPIELRDLRVRSSDVLTTDVAAYSSATLRDSRVSADAKNEPQGYPAHAHTANVMFAKPELCMGSILYPPVDRYSKAEDEYRQSSPYVAASHHNLEVPMPGPGMQEPTRHLAERRCLVGQCHANSSLLFRALTPEVLSASNSSCCLATCLRMERTARQQGWAQAGLAVDCASALCARETARDHAARPRGGGSRTRTGCGSILEQWKVEMAGGRGRRSACNTDVVSVMAGRYR